GRSCRAELRPSDGQFRVRHREAAPEGVLALRTVPDLDGGRSHSRDGLSGTGAVKTTYSASVRLLCRSSPPPSSMHWHGSAGSRTGLYHSKLSERDIPPHP